MKKYMMTLAVVASAVVAQGALIHQWEFNGDATDSVGANNGTLIGGATTAATGGFDGGGYASFDGATGSYVSTGVTYDPAAAFSWAVWANSTTVKTQAIIVGNRRNAAGADNAKREFVKITGNDTVFRPNDKANPIDHTDLTVAAGWTHFAVVNDGAGNVTTYLNGVATGPAEALSDAFVTAALPFYIGGDASPSQNNEFFAGGIDDVRVYDHALTSTEVAALVPEPATLGLIAAFGGGILFIRRRFMI